MNKLTDPFIDDLDNKETASSLANVAWLDAMRQRAKSAYEKFGLPTSRLEMWKYTNLKELHKLEFRQSKPIAANDSIALPTAVAMLDCYKFVLVNGQFNAGLSDIDALPKGVSVSSLAAIIKNTPHRLQNIIGGLRNENSDAMSALNSAYLTDGLFMEINTGLALEKPIHLVSYALNNTKDAVAFHPRHVIHMCERTKATLIESHIGIGDNSLSNSVSEIWVDEAAELGHFKNQSEERTAYHLACTNVRIADDAIYNNFTLQTGGKIARNEVNCEITGSNANAHVNGAYFACGNQHINNTSFIDHAVPRSNSFETFKGVLDDSASAVFQGKILVGKDAQKTDGQQMNRALLLSDKAEVNTKPELEIYADDVKCSHGAAIGALDDNQLFYLMSRGIDEKAARNLLVQAFLYDALDKIPHDGVKKAFHDIVTAKLEGSAT